MKLKFSTETYLALFFLLLAVITLFVWIPLDTATGMVEKVRRQVVIGDALAPTVSAAVILLGAVLMLLRPSDDKSISKQNGIWVILLLVIFIVSLTIMRYAGPVLFAWFDGGYRPLRGTAPLNYMGFLLGGTIMIGGLSSLVARKLSFTYFLIGFMASLVIALIYDVPFDDLILPPNGDI